MNVSLAPFEAFGEVAAPPSKSAAHRALICAALSDAPSRIILSDTNDDIDATVSCLKALGARAEAKEGALYVTPVQKTADCPVLDCGESGSTLRFLLPVAAALCGASLTGRGRLPDRPLNALQNAMRAHGAVFSAEKLPFSVSKMTLGGEFVLPGDVSSQFVSGLLLAAPLLNGDVRIRLTGALESKAYVQMTVNMMARFSVHVKDMEDGYFIPAGQRYHSMGECVVEGDWSSAAFPLALGALTGRVRVLGLNADSAQGDKKILSLLEAMGARIDFSDGAATARMTGRLKALDIDVAGIPDLAPPLCAALMHADGESRLYNAARLRLKESDRLLALCEMTRALGGQARIEGDALLLIGCAQVPGGCARGENDHRIVMAAAVAAAKCRGKSSILGAQAVAKSYPAFFRDYQTLGGHLDVVNVRT